METTSILLQSTILFCFVKIHDNTLKEDKHNNRYPGVRFQIGQISPSVNCFNFQYIKVDDGNSQYEIGVSGHNTNK